MMEFCDLSFLVQCAFELGVKLLLVRRVQACSKKK